MSIVQGALRCAIISLALIMASNGPAGAQEHVSRNTDAVVAGSLLLPVPVLAQPAGEPAVVRSGLRITFEHPRMMNWLTAAFAILQTADVVSTRIALNGGLREQNPFVKGFASHTVGLSLVKASASGAAILLTRRVAAKHRLAGTLLMAGLDGTMGMIVTRNMQAIRRR